MAKGGCHGITPAHAGKRVTPSRTLLGMRDHPRACGEKLSFSFRARDSAGSPPRMRGKAFRCLPHRGPCGITPAHAGKSRRRGHKLPIRQDHPRACGEKPSVLYLFQPQLGSPPRMRGKVLREMEKCLPFRITPAHAGKRGLRPGLRPVLRDHPRACGEKTKKIPYHRLFPLRSAPFSFSFA